MARLITPFFFFRAWSFFFAKLSAVCLWNDCLPLLWVMAKCCSPICLCRSWQPGWLQNACVEEPRAMLGRVLIAGWQRAGELGGGLGCSVLGKSRFSELIWSSSEPSSSPVLVVVWIVARMCDTCSWCLEGKPTNPLLRREQMLCRGNGTGLGNRRKQWECSGNPRLWSKHTARRKYAWY